MKISTNIPIIGLIAAIISILILAVKMFIPAVIVWILLVKFFHVILSVKTFLIIWGVLTFLWSIVPRPTHKTYQITLN